MIGLIDLIETVTHHQRGSSLLHTSQRRQYPLFIVAIQASGRLIQQQQTGWKQQGACQRQPLGLAHRQTGGTIPDEIIPPLAVQDIQSASLGHGIDQLLVTGGATEGQIVTQAAMDQFGVLP